MFTKCFHLPLASFSLALGSSEYKLGLIARLLITVILPSISSFICLSGTLIFTTLQRYLGNFPFGYCIKYHRASYLLITSQSSLFINISCFLQLMLVLNNHPRFITFELFSLLRLPYISYFHFPF